MQAVCIYIILRLDEGETDHNNLDFLLLTTVTVSLAPACFLLAWSDDMMQVLSTQLRRSNLTHDTHSSGLREYGVDARWKDWIFMESCRRSVCCPLCCDEPSPQTLTSSKVIRHLSDCESARLFRSSVHVQSAYRPNSSTTPDEETAVGSSRRACVEDGIRAGGRCSRLLRTSCKW